MVSLYVIYDKVVLRVKLLSPNFLTESLWLYSGCKRLIPRLTFMHVPVASSAVSADLILKQEIQQSPTHGFCWFIDLDSLRYSINSCLKRGFRNIFWKGREPLLHVMQRNVHMQFHDSDLRCQTSNLWLRCYVTFGIWLPQVWKTDNVSNQNLMYAKSLSGNTNVSTFKG